ENVHGQRMRRIVFSIGFSRQRSPALLVFKSTKSRWNFYKKILRGSFHTAWTQRRHAAHRSFDHLIGELLKMQGHVEAKRLGGLEVDDQLVFGRRLHRKFTRVRSAQNPI